MNQKKLDEIRAWWAEIEMLEREGKAIDLISFADAAHAFIPLLLKELDQLRQTGSTPDAQKLLALSGPVLRPKPRDRKRIPLLSRHTALMAQQMALPFEGVGAPTPQTPSIPSS